MREHRRRNAGRRTFGTACGRQTMPDRSWSLDSPPPRTRPAVRRSFIHGRRLHHSPSCLGAVDNRSPRPHGPGLFGYRRHQPCVGRGVLRVSDDRAASHSVSLCPQNKTPAPARDGSWPVVPPWFARFRASIRITVPLPAAGSDYRDPLSFGPTSSGRRSSYPGHRLAPSCRLSWTKDTRHCSLHRLYASHHIRPAGLAATVGGKVSRIMHA